MKQPIPLIASFLLLPIGLLTASASPEQQLAEAHGLNDWDQVEALQFTFFVAKDPPVARSWLWNVPEKTVTRTVDGKSHSIQLDALSGDRDTQVHKQFINDSFWLLFPFSIVWSAPTVTDHGQTEVEIDGQIKQAQKLTALWPSNEGYTPGDAYDLFLDDDQTILAWTFRRSNAAEGKMFIWKNPTALGPIQVYRDYHPDGSATPFIEMRNLKIRLENEDSWLEIKDV